MNFPNAKYTETLMEFNHYNPDFLRELFKGLEGQTLDNMAYSDMLYNAFVNQWNIYEIGGETEDMFKEYVKEDFNCFLHEYKQKLDAYYKAYDYTTANTIEHNGTDNRTRTSSRTTDNTSEYTNNSTTTDYDLPRSVKAESAPSGKSNIEAGGNNTENGTTTGNDTDENTYNDTTRRNDIMMRLKREYMMQITDLFRDFSLRFADCFILVY